MVYQLTVGATTSTPRLNLVPKLKYEYLFLNSFLKMRVDFDAEVSQVMHSGCTLILHADNEILRYYFMNSEKRLRPQQNLLPLLTNF